MSLQSRTAVITRSTSGIGLAIDRAVAQEGANVVINGFGAAEDIEKERALIETEFGVKALAQLVDVSDEARVIEAMSEAARAMGRVDGVIANAGVMQPVKSFLELTGEAYHRLLAINQHGAFYAAREAARRSRSGRPPGAGRRRRSAPPRYGSPSRAAAWA